MKVAHALIRLGDLKKYQYSDVKSLDGEAIELGMEALRRHEQQRNSKGYVADRLLPGETREK